MHLHGIQGLGILNLFNAIEALGDQLGQTFEITGTGNRNQIIATTSGVNLTDSLDIGESFGDSLDLSLLGVDQDDGILHRAPPRSLLAAQVLRHQSRRAATSITGPPTGLNHDSLINREATWQSANQQRAYRRPKTGAYRRKRKRNS